MPKLPYAIRGGMVARDASFFSDPKWQGRSSYGQMTCQLTILRWVVRILNTQRFLSEGILQHNPWCDRYEDQSTTSMIGMLRDSPFKFLFKLKYPADQDFSGHLLRRPKIFEPTMKFPLKFLDYFFCWSFQKSCYSTKFRAPPTHVQKPYENPNDQVKRAGGILVGRENCILASPFQAAKSSHALKIMIWGIWLLPVGHWITM